MTNLSNEALYQRVAQSLEKQTFLTLIGAKLESVEDGKVVISCEWQGTLLQHNGFFHAGLITTLADTAAGYAALTKMDENSDVLSVEFKMNMLRPANTKRLTAVAEVIKSGRTLVVVEACVYSAEDILLAKFNGTMFAARTRD